VRDQNGITTLSVLKVLYLLVVTAVAFMVPAFAITQRAQWFVVPALLALQVIILLACRFPSSEIARPVWRLKWLFLFLIGCYTFLPPESPGAGDLVLPWRVPFVDWLVPLNLTGLERAALMCVQILTLLLASMVVRATGSGNDLVHKTPLFYQNAARRLELQLARAYEYATRHFGGQNLYLEALQQNVRYAEQVSQQPDADLRRQPPSTLEPQVVPYPKDLVDL